MISKTADISFQFTFTRMKGYCFAVLFALLFSAGLAAQTSPVSRPIVLHASVYDLKDSMARPAPLVVNRTMGTGLMAGGGGTVVINGTNLDTFLVAAGGYEMVKFCFRDSAVKSDYTIRVGLKMKEATLAAVSIYPIKDLDEIKKERAGIGTARTTTTEGFTDAVSSPITYMYERFSKEGRSRAAVAMLENQDRQKEILKELFRTYVRSGVIDLDETEFDSFINYLNIPEWYLKSASDYDLALTIRQRFLQYRAAQQMHIHNQR